AVAGWEKGRVRGGERVERTDVMGPLVRFADRAADPRDRRVCVPVLGAGFRVDRVRGSQRSARPAGHTWRAADRAPVGRSAQHSLFTVIGGRTGANEARRVYVGSLDGVEPRLLIEAGSHGRYANGHVLFLRDATLLAQRIDPEALTLQGEAVPIAQGVQMTSR